MIVDNFENIKPLLRFDDSGDNFYFVQIMQRRKDGNDLKKNNRIINNYYITSYEYLSDREEEIKSLCEKFNARAYIGLNPCSFKKSCAYAIKEIADMQLNENYRGILNLMPTLAGKYCNGGENKLWLIDYDSKDESGINIIRETLREANGKEGKGTDKIKTILPTKNGFHIITSAFDPRAYEPLKEQFNFEADIHKDSPTILYIA